MTIKTNVAIMLVTLASLWLAAADDVWGKPAGRQRASVGTARAKHHGSRGASASAPHRYRSTFPPTYYDYPKYTGAFHARYFDELPSIYGTRPMRGTAW